MDISLTREQIYNFSLRFLRPFFTRGSAPWLIASELRYGGYIANVPRNRVSAKDPRSSEEIRRGGMIGGDRMNPFRHSYANKYAEYLHRVIRFKSGIVCAEVGILRGTGLAIWSDLFPDGSIIGLDVDLSHVRNNMSWLKSKGAFTSSNIELHEFDQLDCDEDTTNRIFNDRQIDVFIDDGIHTDEAIINTFRVVSPHLTKSAIYFIEDNKTVYKQLCDLARPFNITSYGELTVLTGPEFPPC